MAEPTSIMTPWEEAQASSNPEFYTYEQRQAATTKEEQNRLVSAERRAFGKSAVLANPIQGVLAAAASPFYEAAVSLGGMKGPDPTKKSEASIQNVIETAKGAGEGLLEIAKMPWDQAKELMISSVKGSGEAIATSIEQLAPWEQAQQSVKTPFAQELTRANLPKNPPPKDLTRKENIQEYVSKLAQIESSGNPLAKNPESSATGLHQFTENTWKETVKKMGANYTLEDRNNPEISNKVAEYSVMKYVEAAKRDLKRTPEPHEVYMYHFLGRTGAPNFLQAPKSKLVTDVVPNKQINANKPLFFNEDGSPKKVGEVLEILKKKFDNA